MKLSIALLIGLSLLAGCGSTSSGPATAPVTGVVTLNGAPVEGAVLLFTPPSAESGFAGAQASTRPDGTFEVRIELDMGKTSKAGLPPGDYRVSVTKLELEPGQSGPMKPPQNVLPPRYATAESTPLTVTVKADSENHFEFPL
jgi:hypothetical protein